MMRRLKMALAGLLVGLALVAASAWLLHHDKAAAGDEKPYTVSLHTPLTFPVNI